MTPRSVGPQSPFLFEVEVVPSSSIFDSSFRDHRKPIVFLPPNLGKGSGPRYLLPVRRGSDASSALSISTGSLFNLNSR